MQPRNAHSHRKTPSEIIADAPPILYINAIIHVISVLWLQNYKVLSLKPNFYSKSLNKNLFLPSPLTNSLLTLKMPCEPWSELIYIQTFKHYSKKSTIYLCIGVLIHIFAIGKFPVSHPLYEDTNSILS